MLSWLSVLLNPKLPVCPVFAKAPRFFTIGAIFCARFCALGEALWAWTFEQRAHEADNWGLLLGCSCAPENFETVGL